MVVIRQNGIFVPRVDPRTREATDEPQQFEIGPHDGRGVSLTIIQKPDWIDEPEIVEVDTVSYR